MPANSEWCNAHRLWREGREEEQTEKLDLASSTATQSREFVGLGHRGVLYSLQLPLDCRLSGRTERFVGILNVLLGRKAFAVICGQHRRW